MRMRAAHPVASILHFSHALLDFDSKFTSNLTYFYQNHSRLLSCDHYTLPDFFGYKYRWDIQMLYRRQIIGRFYSNPNP
jgi:hypothetical protein